MGKEDVLTKIGFNLISFKDTKAIGSFVFMRRLFVQMQQCDLSKLHIIVYIQKQIKVEDLNLPNSCSVEIVRVPNLDSAIKRNLFEQTLFYFYKMKEDVLFSPSSISMPLFTRARKVQTIHDMLPFVFPNKYGKFRLWYIKIMTKIIIKVCDHVITVSKNSKEDIIKYTQISPKKVSIIYNFIPQSEPVIGSHYDNSLVLGVDGHIIKIEKNYFLTVATLQPAKNIEGMLKAFKGITDLYSDFYLYIAGNKGWNYETIFTLTRELLLEKKVIFTGYVDDVNLSKLYRNCFGVIYLSFYEGFGIPPLEGFYHGKACVASNVSSIPEVVGEAGILVNPYDIDEMTHGIERFIACRKLLETKVQKQVNFFNPEMQANEFIRVMLSQKK